MYRSCRIHTIKVDIERFQKLFIFSVKEKRV